MILKLESYLCSICNKNKPLSEFGKAKNIRGHLYSCKVCNRKRTKTYQNNKSSTISGHFYLILNGIKDRAKKKKLEFDITIDNLIELYAKQSGKCALTGIILTYGRVNTGRLNTTISVDRIDNSKGYTKDNIQLLCYIVNSMKSNMTLNEFKYWCNLV